MSRLSIAIAVSATATLLSAAPAEYIDAKVCARCHRQIAEDFARTGMGRSFFRPAPSNTREDFGASGDAFVINGSTNREDLPLEMQLITARITDPGFRPEAARQARKQLEELYLSFEHTAGGPFTLEISRMLASGDPRFGLPQKDEMLKRNFDDAKAWVMPELARGAMEVAIVGDIDIDATIAAVAATLGAVPSRQPKPPHMIHMSRG